ncbi:Ferric reduction oxidase 2 [Acorus gramineus]|uniref:ferric-chelate reductase (NADH) n=1 Tax=Acorus gramineus TaxID=55184 RepID=A0AAV9BAE4_ACOGR|nr:Ferric reduction oxidase 2 [Acorus gramineus]
MRNAMKVLMGLVFAGWMFLWVMLPTNTYRLNWQPKLRSATDSTYFGTQGLRLLVFTFPILFISVVGCLYLHLGKKSSKIQSQRKNSHLDTWRRPVLVKGPLGVVSAIELAFSLMFLALIIWIFATYINNGFKNLRTKKQPYEMWMMKLEDVGLRFALMGNICCAFLFFPVTRGSSLLPLVGLTSEGSIKYHIWLGHIVLAFFAAHGVCFVIFWAVTNHMAEMIKWSHTDISNVAGELALLFGLVMWVTTIPRIRRKAFEVFFYSHQLYFLFLFFYLLHVGINFFCYILPGVYLFLIDRYLRFLQSRQNVRLVSARLLPCEAIELNFSKSRGFSYSPMSTIFLNVPSVSRLQWHPYTVTSNSNLEPERLSIVIKKEGSWTQKLYQTLSSPSLDRLDISVEGPYGPTSASFPRYDTLVMISGGSGITPFISIIREFIFRSTTADNRTAPTPNILLICAFKNSLDLTMLDLLLPVTGAPSETSLLPLKVEAFVTREKANPESDQQKLIRTVWFKPLPSDAPVSPVLGPNTWLWLGAIISSSFVAFLLILGITYRYYIYPIDHNTNDVYSSSSRALLNLLFICACIAVTSGVAVQWNKRKNCREANQIQNMDVPTPTTSPGSWFYDADRELESLPHQSLVQATTLHYGARPDLRKMLLEMKEEGVGVMASGPAEMRHEVATICSSGLADNLHYESISFSW